MQASLFFMCSSNSLPRFYIHQKANKIISMENSGVVIHSYDHVLGVFSKHVKLKNSPVNAHSFLMFILNIQLNTTYI